jgi:hypothetical protein
MWSSLNMLAILECMGIFRLGYLGHCLVSKITQISRARFQPREMLLLPRKEQEEEEEHFRLIRWVNTEK